jgi:hypothetical protein
MSCYTARVNLLSYCSSMCSLYIHTAYLGKHNHDKLHDQRIWEKQTYLFFSVKFIHTQPIQASITMTNCRKLFARVYMIKEYDIINIIYLFLQYLRCI